MLHLPGKRMLLMASGSEMFAPTTVAGCRFWLSTPLLTGLNDNDACPTGTDQSGNGYNVTAAGAARPTYKTNIQNGRPVLRFDGAANRMIGSALSNLITASAYTAFVVASITTISTDAANYWDNDVLWADPDAYAGLFFRTAGGGTALLGNYGAGEHADQIIVPATWYVFEMRHDSGSLYLSVNGGAAGTAVSGDTSSLAGTLAIGGSATQFLAFDLGELSFHNVALTADQRAGILAYYKDRWGIA